MTTRAMLIFSVLGMAAVVAAPAFAKDPPKVGRANQVERTTIERMPALVAEPGDRATVPVGPADVGRAYQNAIRRDTDRQLNRGY